MDHIFIELSEKGKDVFQLSELLFSSKFSSSFASAKTEKQDFYGSFFPDKRLGVNFTNILSLAFACIDSFAFKLYSTNNWAKICSLYFK